MRSDQDDLSGITREILVPGGSLIDLLSQALALRNLFEALAPLRIDPHRDIATGEKRLGSGLAISPTLGAMCLVGMPGLGDRVTDARCTDAASYRIPPNALPDVIVSETCCRWGYSGVLMPCCRQARFG
jgi:hypothetical protein